MPRKKKSEEAKIETTETEEVEEMFEDDEITEKDYEYEQEEDSDDYSEGSENPDRSRSIKKNQDVKLEKKDIIEAVADLKLKCIECGIPMFISLAFKNEKKKVEYHNDCVYAALDEPEYGTRIADLLCVMLGAETKYPDYIQDAINTLQAWQNNERTFDTGVVLSDNRFRDYLDIADGQMKPMIINDREEEEIIVTTASKLKKAAEEKLTEEKTDRQSEKKTSKRTAKKTEKKSELKTEKKTEQKITRKRTTKKKDD